jgi:hypothetical protein
MTHCNPSAIKYDGQNRVVCNHRYLYLRGRVEEEEIMDSKNTFLAKLVFYYDAKGRMTRIEQLNAQGTIVSISRASGPGSGSGFAIKPPASSALEPYPMTKSSLLLFDIDGTILTSGGAGETAFARGFSRRIRSGGKPDSDRHLGRTDSSIARQVLAKQRHRGKRRRPRSASTDTFVTLRNNCP